MLILVELDISVNGKTICSTATGRRVGTQGKHPTMDSSSRERSTEREDSLGKMEATMKVISKMVSLKGMANTTLQIWRNFMMESLEEEIWKEEALRAGVMAEDTREILRMARKMEKAHSFGPLEINILAAGGQTSSTA